MWLCVFFSWENYFLFNLITFNKFELKLFDTFFGSLPGVISYSKSFINLYPNKNIRMCLTISLILLFCVNLISHSLVPIRFTNYISIKSWKNVCYVIKRWEGNLSKELNRWKSFWEICFFFVFFHFESSRIIHIHRFRFTWFNSEKIYSNAKSKVVIERKINRLKSKRIYCGDKIKQMLCIFHFEKEKNSKLKTCWCEHCLLSTQHQ